MNKYLQILDVATNYEKAITNALSGIGIILLIIIVPLIIVSILSIVAKCKIRTKVGVEWWKQFIPFYSAYTFYPIAGLNGIWFATAFVSYFVGQLSEISSALSGIASLAVFALVLYQKYLYSTGLAKNFGKDTSFAVAIFFVQPIAEIILAFSQAQYEGPIIQDDFIFEKIFGKEKNEEMIKKQFKSNSTINVETNQNSYQNQQNIQTENQLTQHKFCTQCGAKLEENISFCTQCGSKIN